MVVEFTFTSVFNLAAVIIIGVASVLGAKAVRSLYSDEFASTINWMVIIIEAIFIIQLIIFLTFYFEISTTISTVFVLISTLFIAMLFFFATYKIVQFLQKYAFGKEELSKQSINQLIKKKEVSKK